MQSLFWYGLFFIKSCNGKHYCPGLIIKLIPFQLFQWKEDDGRPVGRIWSQGPEAPNWMYCFTDYLSVWCSWYTIRKKEDHNHSHVELMKGSTIATDFKIYQQYFSFCPTRKCLIFSLTNVTSPDYKFLQLWHCNVHHCAQLRGHILNWWYGYPFVYRLFCLFGKL